VLRAACCVLRAACCVLRANSLRRCATGTGHVDPHRGHDAPRQVAHREAELFTPLTLLVLNADVTEQATEDEIGRYVGFLKRESNQASIHLRPVRSAAVKTARLDDYRLAALTWERSASAGSSVPAQ
jgi:hypothetical protein